ncbi:DUF6644 family protein [Phenylobacterium sp. VNQ135]|uniref:DUF6644 family protein n=1 Tax=Phenylobacterium sp. VNQ135 TaxID=3400922 RepID=UPI003C0E624C
MALPEAVYEFAAAIEATPLGVAARSGGPLYPVANLLHLLALTLLIGGIGVVDLRLLGFARSLPLPALSRFMTRFAVAGLILFVLTGAVLFASDAGPLSHSSVFLWKMTGLALGLVNAFVFNRIYEGRLTDWDAAPPLAGRLMAAGSLLIWLTVGALGRFIAYSA